MIKDMYARQEFETNRFLLGTKSLWVVSTERAVSIFPVNVQDFPINGSFRKPGCHVRLILKWKCHRPWGHQTFSCRLREILASF